MKELFKSILLQATSLNMAKNSIDIKKLSAIEKKLLLLELKREEDDRINSLSIVYTLGEIKRMEAELFYMIHDYHSEQAPDIKHALYNEINRVQHKFCRVCFTN